jgi:tetratricopeptide (TPR) repeat protein
MKFFIKKTYIIFFLLTILLIRSEAFAKESSIQYKRKDISNYFSGIISINQVHNDNKAFDYLGKIQSIHNRHSQYNIEFIRTLILLEKFKQALVFSKKVWSEDELFLEADLLLGLNSFIKKDYKRAEKYFERLNKISRYNLVFDNFIGNILIAWIRASQGNEEDSYKFIEKIPNSYNNLKRIQNIFLKCYFNSDDTQKSLEELIEDENYNFSRYNFFLVNYLLSKNKIIEAKKIIQNSRKKYNSNLLIKQTEFFFLNDKNKKIRNFFDCKNPKDSLAEFFYVIANLYSSEKEYRLSNFYLKISLFLNNKFLPNKALLAENFYYQKKFEESKSIYYSLKSIGSVYSWHASKNIASILLDEKGKKYSVSSLEDDFNLLPNPNYEHYYELANFYKDNEYYKESIKYYSLALRKIKNDHSLVPKIFDRRGTSFERLGDWENAEKDLIESLKILPDQAHVLNYLAYSWIDRGINLDRGLEMLKKATELRKNDGYIIDSLGWAYYAKKDYDKAKFFLQKAVELLPSDPIINDHYADTLWMLNKNIQARYIWSNVLKLKGTEEKLKGDIKKKIIFGITR